LVEPVQVKVAVGFRFLCGVKPAPVLGLTVRKTIGLRAQFVLPPLGALAGKA